MKKLTVTLSALLLSTLMLTACDEGPAEEAGSKVDEAAENIGDTLDDVGNGIKDAATDAGNAIEDTCEDVKEGVDMEDTDC